MSYFQRNKKLYINKVNIKNVGFTLKPSYPIAAVLISPPVNEAKLTLSTDTEEFS